MALVHMRLNSFVKYSNAFKNARFCSSHSKKGLVLGVYAEKNTNDIKLTAAAKNYNESTGGKLLKSIKFASNDKLKCEKPYIFWNLCEEYHSVAVVGIGEPNLGYNELEEIDERKEAIRIAAHVGLQAFKSLGIKKVDFDGMGSTQAVAEGATLSNFTFNTYKKEQKSPIVDINQYQEESDEWKKGIIKARSQNLARLLAETPSNFKAPKVFAERAKEELEKVGVKIEVRDKKWIENMKMGGLISVSQGSDEPPVLLEMKYEGGGAKPPIVFVGKGVTFDAGGYALKPSKGMDLMRGDCGGAAAVVGTMKAIAQLKLPINVVGLVPLTENLINGKATKPGDVITMMNGKTVAVDNPDAEGRLILGDALTYSAKFNPEFVLDIATLTGAIVVALGHVCTGVYTNSVPHWQILQQAGSNSGDRMWRMPLWKFYTKQMTDYTGYDVNNVGQGAGGGSCTAAAFLREFVPENVPWAHLDIAGVAIGPTGDTIIPKGMTGKPTRTLINFLEQLSKRS